MIKNVVFDIGKVLVRSYWKEFMEIKGRSKETRNKISELTLNSELWQQIDLGEISLDEMIEIVKKKNPKLTRELNEFFRDYSEYTIIDKEVERFLMDLKAEKYNIYLLSNYGKEFFEDLEKKADFVSHVDGRIISYEVKFKKPDLEIYNLLIEKYNLMPEETVFIDDSKENILAAKQMKFQTILFRNLEQVKANFYAVIEQSKAI